MGAWAAGSVSAEEAQTAIAPPWGSFWRVSPRLSDQMSWKNPFKQVMATTKGRRPVVGSARTSSELSTPPSQTSTEPWPT